MTHGTRLSGSLNISAIPGIDQQLHYFGKFTSERDVIDWVNAHSNLTKLFAKNTIDEPQQADRSC
jgi:hypothetical protein